MSNIKSCFSFLKSVAAEKTTQDFIVANKLLVWHSCFKAGINVVVCGGIFGECVNVLSLCTNECVNGIDA